LVIIVVELLNLTSIMTDKLEIEYRRLCDLKQLKGNSKKHATENTIASILELGFKDPIGYDPSLNGGKGGITEGHDRCAALLAIKKRKIDRPRGIDIDNDGEWMVPILVGVPAKNEAQAIKYSIIHNHSTIHGAGLDLATELKLFDTDLLISQAEYLDEEGENLGVIGDLNSILEALNTLDDLDDSDNFESNITDNFSGKNKEIDIEGMDGQMIIKLSYTENEYWQVKEQLSKIASTPEQAVWKLLGND
jgi:hypothetical protein